MLRVNLGDLLVWNDEEYVVAANSPPATLLRRISDQHSVWVDLLTLADEMVPTSHPPVETSADEIRHSLSECTESELDLARWWVPHLNEVEFGVTDPDDPHLQPRAGYGPGTSKTEREQQKVAELNAAGMGKVSPRSLQRKGKAYRDSGLYGLVDRRASARKQQAPRTDERIVEAVLAVLASSEAASTVSVTSLIDKTRAFLTLRYRDEAPSLPSDRTMRRIFAAYDRRKLATGDATTRRSDANRHDRTPRPVRATTPGQYVEIDSTPVNVLTMMPDGKPARAHLTVAVDLATRSILGFDLVPVGATGVEHADLLARILRPRPCQTGAQEATRLDTAQDLPVEAMQASDQRQRGALAVPYIVPETITTDRGKDYLSETFVSACRTFGISVIAAPPSSPTFKGHIERLMGTIETSWMQKLPGYIGNSVTNRGKAAEKDKLLTLRELRDSFEQWWVRVYQRTPHAELRDRDVPGRCYSPNQMYTALFDAGAGVPVPIDSDTFISLMPTYRRTIQNDGIHIDLLTYWHKDLVELRKRAAPTRDGKWVARKDPYDPDRVWVQHPEDGHWIECVSDSYQRTNYPFSSGLRLLRNLDEAPADVGRDWAAEQLVQAAVSVTSPKRKGRKSVRSDSVKQRRHDDGDPRPGPIPDPPPPDQSAQELSDDEFSVVRSEDRRPFRF